MDIEYITAFCADCSSKVDDPDTHLCKVDLVKAVGWVWTRLCVRGGMAPKSELDLIWDHDPQLLDDALLAMRKAGIVSYLEPCWYIL